MRGQEASPEVSHENCLTIRTDERSVPELPDEASLDRMIRDKLESAHSWHKRLLERGTNFNQYGNGAFEIHTLVPVGDGLDIVLNDAYWERLCICEVNRVPGAGGLAGIITVWLFGRDRGDTERLGDFSAGP